MTTHMLLIASSSSTKCRCKALRVQSSFSASARSQRRRSLHVLGRNTSREYCARIPTEHRPLSSMGDINARFQLPMSFTSPPLLRGRYSLFWPGCMELQGSAAATNTSRLLHRAQLFHGGIGRQLMLQLPRSTTCSVRTLGGTTVRCLSILENAENDAGGAVAPAASISNNVNPNDEAKQSMLRTINEAAEHDLKRILAISDQFFSEEEEKEERRRAEEGDDISRGTDNSRGHRRGNDNGKKRRRKARKSLRDRVAYELRRRRLEHSTTGLDERRVRMVKRRRHWEVENGEQRQQQLTKIGEESGGDGNTRKRKGRPNVEGLGLPPASSSSFYASNSGRADIAAVSSDGADVASTDELPSLLDGNGSDIGTTKVYFNNAGHEARTEDLEPMEKSTEATSVRSAFGDTQPMAGGSTDTPSLMDLLDGGDDYDDGGDDDAREQLNDIVSPKTDFDTGDEMTVTRAGTNTTVPSLMELLEDTSAQHESYTSNKSMYATEDALVGPSVGSKAPSLMDLLDDDSSVLNYENDASADEAAHTGATKTKKEHTLLELLEDDSLFSNEEDTREYNNQSLSGAAEASSESAPCKLMDLLNENFDVTKKEGSDSRILEADDAQVQARRGLIDLLNENFTSVKPSHGEFSIGRKTTFEAEDTLADVSAQVGPLYSRHESIAETAVTLDTSSAVSLLDLLDDGRDEGSSNAGVVPDGKEKHLDTAFHGCSSSLPNILGDTAFAAGVHLETEKEELDSEASTGTLLDLLDDIPVERSPSESIKSVDLLSLLDADGDYEYGSDSFDTSSSDRSHGEAEAAFVSSTLDAAAIVDELLALLISASRSEWISINAADGAKEYESQATEEALVSEVDVTLRTLHYEQQTDASLLIESLLSGVQRAQWFLSTDELNVMLLHLAMLETTHETMDMLVKIFKYMEECKSRGHLNAAPNAATYSILMTAFGKRGYDFRAAAFVCKQMIEALESNTGLSEGDGVMLHIDEDAVDIGIRSLKRCDDVQDAETLLLLALGQTGAGVDVRMSVYNNLLQLYKENDTKEKALELLDVCVRERSGNRDARRLDRFVRSLIRWPRTNRSGSKIAAAEHNQRILEYLEEQCNDDDITDELEYKERYRPSSMVWRELLVALSWSARHETKGHFELVRRACQGLVNCSANSSRPDHVVLKLGLEAAEALGDAKLAADLIHWTWQSALQFVETSPSTVSTSFETDQAYEPRGILEADDDLAREFDTLFAEGNDAADGIGDQNTVPVSEGRPKPQPSPGDDDTINVTTIATTEKEGDSGLLSLLDEEDAVVDSQDKHSQQVGESASAWTTEHAEGPPRNFIHIPPKAYYQAIKICLARGNVELAHSILNAGCSSSGDVDFRLPESSRSHLYTLVMTGYAQSGEIQTAKELLVEMQNAGPRPTEHTYAAFIHALAVGNHSDEAIKVLDAMINNEHEDGVRPQSSCFSACMLSALKRKDYQRVIELNTKMIDCGVKPDSQSYFGVVLASTRLGDRKSALNAAEAALKSKLPISHDGFDLMCKVLLPNNFGDGSIDAIRRSLRQTGLDNRRLTVDANKLIRSLRMVDIEERRSAQLKDAEKVQKLWHDCLADLCTLAHKVHGT